MVRYLGHVAVKAAELPFLDMCRTFLVHVLSSSTEN